jgi:hypothetical protein
VEKGGRKKIQHRGMEEAPENNKESYSAQSNGMNKCNKHFPRGFKHTMNQC